MYQVVNLQTPETKTEMKWERLNQIECDHKLKRVRFKDVCEKHLQASTLQIIQSLCGIGLHPVVAQKGPIKNDTFLQKE